MRALAQITLLLTLGYMTIIDTNQATYATATFAGGCFWCMEAAFGRLEGVQSVTSGYMGGRGPNPNYSDYANKGYVEVIHITYDPKKRSYQSLLETFWRQIDPTDAGGQFADRGVQYRSIIFYHTPEQMAIAGASREKLNASGRFEKPIVTEITAATKFYPAEEYHQDYKEKNPLKYGFYRWRSGRDQHLESIWNKPKTKSLDAQLREKLTPLQYAVTKLNQTEPPFSNEYWNNKQPGIYIDVISGKPLFSSRDQLDSKTGWPSFTKPLVPENIVEKEDRGWFTTHTEVRSKHADSHLGHIFNDGPEPTGLRYCINSAALRFIPADKLEQKGYAKYAMELY